MKYDDIKIGEYYSLNDGLSKNEQGKEELLIFVVGRDPFTGKLVASCDDWMNKVDLLSDDDYQFMEKI